MSDLNEQILDAWIQLTTVINNDRIVSAMPLNEALICRILMENREKRMTATDLCARTAMQKSQMNRTLTSMEEKGWICRKRSEEDKRQVWIWLMEDQLTLYKEQHERIMKIVNQLIAHIGEEKAVQALELFTLIAEIAEKEL